MECPECKKEVTRIRTSGNGVWFCNNCAEVKADNAHKVIRKVFYKDYGWVSEARVREVKRRVVLPYAKKDGGYYLGRIGENGKIQEKNPTY